MGIIKKVAALGAVVAAGAVVVNRDAVKKAVRGLIGSGNDAVHHLVEKTDKLATRADKALAPAVTAAKTKVKAVARAAKPTGKKPGRKTRQSHAST